MKKLNFSVFFYENLIIVQYNLFSKFNFLLTETKLGAIIQYKCNWI